MFQPSLQRRDLIARIDPGDATGWPVAASFPSSPTEAIGHRVLRSGSCCVVALDGPRRIAGMSIETVVRAFDAPSTEWQRLPAASPGG